MPLERQEAIARRTDELLAAWLAFEPAPLAPFDTSAAALSWLALARDAVADIRRADALPQEDPLQEDPLQEDPPKDEMVSPEVFGAPSPDAIPLVEDALLTTQAESTPDAAPAGQAGPLTAGEADIVTIGGEIAMVASLAGGSADDGPAPAITVAVPADVTAADAVVAEMDDGVNAVAFAETIILDNDDLPFPMLSPFEGDDASAALARAVSEGLALRTDRKPKARDKSGDLPVTVHPGSLSAYMGPPTSGTRLSSP